MAALRLGVAVSEAAGVGEMAAGLLADAATDEGGVDQLLGPLSEWMASDHGEAYLAACKHLNKPNEDETRTPTSVAATVSDWLAGIKTLGQGHERDLRKLAQISARLYLFAADTLEHIAWVEHPDVLAKAADKNSAAAELSAVSKWLAKPDSDGTLAKAVVAVYLKEVLQGKTSGKKEKPVRLRRSSSSGADGAEAAASSSSSSKAKKAKKRAKRNDQKEAKKMAKPGARQFAEKKRKESKPGVAKDAKRQVCLLEDSSQESPSNAALAAALSAWSAAESACSPVKRIWQSMRPWWTWRLSRCGRPLG